MPGKVCIGADKNFSFQSAPCRALPRMLHAGLWLKRLCVLPPKDETVHVVYGYCVLGQCLSTGCWAEKHKTQYCSFPAS